MKTINQATLIMVHRVFKSKAIGKHSNFDRSCFQLWIVGGLGGSNSYLESLTWLGDF